MEVLLVIVILTGIIALIGFFDIVKRFCKKFKSYSFSSSSKFNPADNPMKSDKGMMILWIIITHLASLVLAYIFASPDDYAVEHRFYYFIFLIFSGLVYLYRTGIDTNKPAMVFKAMKENITPILIITIVGLVFQNFPDWDNDISFLSHRSILTHSVFVLLLFHLLLIKNSDLASNNRLIINSIYMGMVIGITSHLFVDISYMFLFSPTIFLSAHKGHGWMPALPSEIEVPYLLLMALISLNHLNQILKIRFNANIVSNVFRFQKLKEIEVYETVLLLYLAINMLCKSLVATNLPSTILIGFWALVFIIISTILFKTVMLIKGEKTKQIPEEKKVVNQEVVKRQLNPFNVLKLLFIVFAVLFMLGLVITLIEYIIP